MEIPKENGEKFKTSRKAHGLTGVLNRDGIPTLEQCQLLNQIQAKAADDVVSYLDQMTPGDKFPLVSMATGIGKGKIIHEVIKRQKQSRPDFKVLVLAGTKTTLVEQMGTSLSGYVKSETDNKDSYVGSEDSDDENIEIDESEIEEGEFSGYLVGKYGDKTADVQVTTLQKIKSEDKREKLNPGETDLIIIDEVHNAGTRQVSNVVTKFPKVVGFTATPHRFSGNMRSPEDYGFQVVTSYPLPEAQEARLLPPLYALQLNTAEIIEEIPTTLGGKIDFKAMERILKDSPELRTYIVDKLVPIITLNGNNYKTVVAVNFVWEAYHIARLLREKGIKVGVAVNEQAAKTIDSDEIPALDSIRRYKLPEDDPESIQVLVSPYVASEGFDAPATEVLVWASPTDSHLRYTQYTGRLARRCNGKAYGVVIDCLYQTSQYNWTYNFGMWMKGNVRQLSNGMLYLGPMELVDDISTIQQMHDLADHTSLRELQSGEILPMQESDFALKQTEIENIFQGNAEKSGKLGRISNEVINRLKEQNPDLFTKRINGKILIEVCKDRKLFVQEMVNSGAKLIDRAYRQSIEPVQPEDFALTETSMHAFQGNFDKNSRLRRTYELVVETMKSEHPDLFTKRISGTIPIEVCKDRKLFIQEMVKLGAKLAKKDLLKPKVNDFVLGYYDIGNMFLGAPDKNSKLKKIWEIVVNKLKREHPDLFVQRIRGRQPMDAFMDRDLFIQEMLKAGAILRQK